MGGGGRLCSRWAAALGPMVDALVTSVDGGGAAAAGVLPNSRSGVAGLGGPGLRPGMRAGRRGGAAREPWSRRPSRCRRGGAGGRRRSSPPCAQVSRGGASWQPRGRWAAAQVGLRRRLIPTAAGARGARGRREETEAGARGARGRLGRKKG